MTESERCFVEKAIGRKLVFLRLSVLGIVVGALLAAYYVYLWWAERIPPDEMEGRAITGVVVVVLVLLNARQNLRQYRYAGALEKLLPDGFGAEAEDTE